MYESIFKLSQTYPLSVICSTLKINKSSYLYWVKNEKDNNEEALFYQNIISIYAESKGIYGAPKITIILQREYDCYCSVSKVSRAMNILGIKSIVTAKFKKKSSSLTNEEKKKIVNLVKGLILSHINQVWTTDITYIKTINEGTFYLISFIDLYSKKVISWDLFDNQKADSVVIVLKQAIKTRNPSPGLICHSDKGSQMRSNIYRETLSKNNIAFSYTSLNHSCDENAAQESFHASLKKEVLYQTKLYTYEDAFREIYNYIEGFYNPIRIHSSIGYLSPNDFEKLKCFSKTPSI